MKIFAKQPPLLYAEEMIFVEGSVKCRSAFTTLPQPFKAYFVPVKLPGGSRTCSQITESSDLTRTSTHHDFFLCIVERLNILFSRPFLKCDQPASTVRSFVQAPRPIFEDPSVLGALSSRCKAKCYKLSHLVFSNQSLLQSVISYCPVDSGGKQIPVQFLTTYLSICRHLLCLLNLFLI